MCGMCLCVCVFSYLLLLSQYEAVSFCDALFASYVLLPLQQRHSTLLRKTVWGEHCTVLHSLSVPPSQVINAALSANVVKFINVTYYFHCSRDTAYSCVRLCGVNTALWYIASQYLPARLLTPKIHYMRFPVDGEAANLSVTDLSFMLRTCHRFVVDLLRGSFQLVTELLRGNWCNGFWP